MYNILPSPPRVGNLEQGGNYLFNRPFQGKDRLHPWRHCVHYDAHIVWIPSIDGKYNMKAKQNNPPRLDDLRHLADTCMTEEEKQLAETYVISAEGGSCFDGRSLDCEFAIIYAGRTTNTKGFSYRFKHYPFYRLVYTVSGSATIESSGGMRTSTAGSIYGLAPKKLSEIKCSSETPWSNLYIHYTGREAGEIHKRIFRGTSVIHTAHPSQIQVLFENIADECIERGDHYQTICDAYLKILLLKLASENERHVHVSPSQATFLRCKNHIEKNFESIVDIGQIAESCAIGKSYLHRLFKEHAGTTPMAYIAERKMKRAAWLLINTDFTIKQISFSLHFNNQHYFSSVFRKTFGVSPTLYRRNHWKKSGGA